MRRLLLPLLALTLLGAAPPDDAPVVRRWVEAVLAHRPGTADRPLVDMSLAPAEDFAVVARMLRGTLEREFSTRESRNDVRRRGALLHTDIALLLPERAAAFTQLSDGRVRIRPDRLVVSADGQYIDSDVGHCHWGFASWLLGGVTPDPSSDEFVRLWYRAIAATFQSDYRFGSSEHHLRRARDVLPRDPVLLFYAGALHEALASPRFQSVPVTAPGEGRDIALPSGEDQLRAAERELREALKLGAPPQARLRLGRVLGGLGKHAEAAALLEQAVAPSGDAQVAYLRELFLGTEQGALGRVDAAVASFERAATLYPTAHAPLVAMSDLLRRSGDRAGALGALRRLAALPADVAERVDPWWDYHRSYAADAVEQLAKVRAWVDAGGSR